MKLSEIHIRDPYVLVYEKTYYLYGTRGATAWGMASGFDVFVSDDLEEWTYGGEIFKASEDFWADRHFWAPEVHYYKGAFYLLASFKAEGRCRGTQILRATSPLGPFEIHSDGPVTPTEWECLDGTLYVEDGMPYMVFCHEWLQVKDGEMCMIALTENLDRSVGEPIVLFRASEPSWMQKEQETFITDGPWLYKCQDESLLMLWSSYAYGRYVEAVSKSTTGKLCGPWIHEKELLFDQNGGHGMHFKTLVGDLMFTLHVPNEPHPMERPQFVELEEAHGKLSIKNKESEK